MKTRTIRVRIDEEFEKKLEYIRYINGYPTISSTIRKTIEKEYRKEIVDNGKPC